MTETNPTNREYVFHDGFFSVGPLSLKISRILATCLVVLIIAVIWHRDGWDIEGILYKSLSVVLLVDVLFSPSLMPWREKRSGKKVESSAYAEMGYRWLMLMAMLVLPLLLRIH